VTEYPEHGEHAVRSFSKHKEHINDLDNHTKTGTGKLAKQFSSISEAAV